MHCDITTKRGVDQGNIVAKVGNLVKDYAKNNSFRQSDFCRIIHIADMDGAFIPNDCIIENVKAKKPLYSATEIQTNNMVAIKDRNQRKSDNLNRLLSISEIWKIPYQIFYMSCNLDHALYNNLNITDKEKEANAVRFAQKYRDDIPAFLKFISSSDFSVTNGYIPSWKFIKAGLHSLERHTNLGICFEQDLKT
jgi:hypothetical protein